MKRYPSLFLLFSLVFVLIACSKDDEENIEVPVSTDNINANNGTLYSMGLEIPHITDYNYFFPRTTTVNGKTIVTYSIEYNVEKKHSVWTAFTFQADTRSTEWKRSNWDSTSWGGDPFQPDPDLMSQERTDLEDYYYETPYVRGHIVASYDRVYSKDANEQTFYLSNISPMLSSFNSGSGSMWNPMEQIVQEWGRKSTFCDTLFVVKGGTIRDGEIATGAESYLPLQKHGLTVPRYYYSAILCKNAGSYKAIAFWFEHKPSLTGSLRSYAITVDSLETLTGIDFFCNLPDVLETAVESSINISSWTGL